MAERRLDPKAIPRHVAIIMDGNGRWAEAQGLTRVEGHRHGLESVRAVVRAGNELGLDVLTLYAFSEQNWNRPKQEVEELMRLLEHYLDTELDEVHRNGIRVRAIGRIDRLLPTLQAKIAAALERTRDNREMELVFAISYGGRGEIVDAAKRLLRDAEEGKVDAEHLDEKTFAAYLYDPEVPDPDLMIRTGNESRVSNFLLWQIAYAELYLTDIMWPDFSKAELVNALLEYQARERRFGMTSAQVRDGESASGS